MANVEKTIFISYRRKDISWALAVYQYLTSQHYDVFFDYTSIPSGDFEQIIVGNIRARAHFVLILTPTALDRCINPGDWLRREIETAIDEKRNIIPLFFDGFSFGTPAIAEKLTGKMSTINRYNGLDIPSGYFLEAMERLRSRYLNVPLDAVLHPIPTEVRKVVEEQHAAADKALEQKKDVIEQIVKPVAEKAQAFDWKNISSKLTPRVVAGIATGLLLISLVLWGITKIGNNPPQSVVPEPTQTSSPTPTRTPPPDSTNTPTVTAPLTPSVTLAPPTPTLGIGSTLVSEKDDMTLHYVPAGKFPMGSDAGDLDESPVHDVVLSAFWIDEIEVTNKMYSACVQAGTCTKPRDEVNYLKTDFHMHPVVYVDWYDAQAYCTWAGRRLPTEAEWEKVASWDPETESKRVFPWGNNLNCTFANYYDTSQRCVGLTTAVGSYPKGKSPYKVFDMMGNVSEWVYDWYQQGYYSLLEDVTFDPTGPVNGDNRVLRGGSWRSFNDDVSSAGRFWSVPSYTSSSIGFRCAMDAE